MRCSIATIGRVMVLAKEQLQCCSFGSARHVLKWGFTIYCIYTCLLKDEMGFGSLCIPGLLVSLPACINFLCVRGDVVKVSFDTNAMGE